MRVQSGCDSIRPTGVRHINDKRMSGSEIVRDYVTRVWNKRDPTAIKDYIGEPCWRHDAGEPERQFMKFDHEFQMVRAREGYEAAFFDFQIVKLLESGEFVTMIWNLNFKPATEEVANRLRKQGDEHGDSWHPADETEDIGNRLERQGAVTDENGNLLFKGIEVFHILDGKIVEVWVAQGFGLTGHWGPTMT